MAETVDRSVFASIEEALDELRAGRMLIVVDDADRENEGDFVMAAEHATRMSIRAARSSCDACSRGCST